MLRDEYLRRLVDASYLDLYLSGNEGARIYWPWRMQPVHEASSSYRNACESYIIDSSFKDETITNEDVLNKAYSLNAEYAVLADVYQNKDATVKAIREGIKTYKNHIFDGDVIVPLQAPHDKCYQEIGEELDYVAVGGLKDASDRKQIAATKSLRSVVSEDTKIHGLGFSLSNSDGSPNRWVREMQENSNLLDSIDTSAYIQRMICQDHVIDKGEERRSVDCMEISRGLVRDLRRVSEFAELDSQNEQTTLEV